MTDQPSADSAQPQPRGPEDSQQADSEDSEPADLVDQYDDEQLRSDIATA